MHIVAFRGYVPAVECSSEVGQQVPLVRCLIDHGASLHARDNHSRTPFDVALENNHGQMVEALLDLGWSVDEKDAHGVRHSI